MLLKKMCKYVYNVFDILQYEYDRYFCIIVDSHVGNIRANSCEQTVFILVKVSFQVTMVSNVQQQHASEFKGAWYVDFPKVWILAAFNFLDGELVAPS